MKNKKYPTVGTVLKYPTVGTVLKYPTVGTIQKSNRRIVEPDKIDTPKTHIRDNLLPSHGTGTSIKRCDGKLVLWATELPSSCIDAVMQEVFSTCECYYKEHINLDIYIHK